MSYGSLRELTSNTLSTTYSRRGFLRRVGAVGLATPAIAGLLAACADDDDDDSETPQQSATEPASSETDDDESEETDDSTEEPSTDERGGDLVLAWLNTQEPANLDSQVDPYASATLLNSWVTDFPVLLTTDQEYAPFLATSWESNEDGSAWTFDLRDDRVFQDGEPFDAEAFKANIDRIMDPDTLSALRASSLGSAAFDSVTVDGDYTATVNYTEPFVTVVPGMAATPIWSPAAFEQYGEDFTNHLTGCGAFRLTGWNQGSEITFEKWPEYQGGAPNQDHEGPAFLDTITVRLVGEQAVLGEVLRTGEVNMVYQLPFQALSTYMNDDNFTVVPTYQGGTGNHQVLNLERPPLDDIRVRRALRHSYDPQDLNDTLYDGINLTVYGPLTSFTRCYWDGAEDAYPFDPELSKQLLDEAGWIEGSDGVREKDGQRLSLVGVALSTQEILEYLETRFRAIGVELIIELVPGPVQLERAIAGDFDVMFQHLSSVEPDVLFLVWHSENLRPGGWAWSRFQDERVDELLDMSKRVADPDERCELFVEVQQIVSENVPSLPTISVAVNYAMSADVKGFDVGGAVRSYFYINNMYIEE